MSDVQTLLLRGLFPLCVAVGLGYLSYVVRDGNDDEASTRQRPPTPPPPPTEEEVLDAGTELYVEFSEELEVVQHLEDGEERKKKYAELAERTVQCLLKIDSVVDPDLRDRRRSLVKSLQGLLSRLDELRANDELVSELDHPDSSEKEQVASEF